MIAADATATVAVAAAIAGAFNDASRIGECGGYVNSCVHARAKHRCAEITRDTKCTHHLNFHKKNWGMTST